MSIWLIHFNKKQKGIIFCNNFEKKIKGTFGNRVFKTYKIVENMFRNLK